MKRLMILLLLTACTTPKTMLLNDKTGQVVSCGGQVSTSVVGNVLGHYMQRMADEKCRDDYEVLGFKIIRKDEG